MPRPLANSGLPGPGQERFPEQAKELGRRQGLYDEAIIYRFTETEDGGGSQVETYTPDVEPVDARLDWYQTSANRVTADQIDESSRHVISFRNAQAITTRDRVSIDGKMWDVEAIRDWTDELINQVEVMETIT